MAKISKRDVYVPKLILSLKDYFVITDSEDSKRTKTTGFENVLTAINAANGVATLSYRFSAIQDEDINFDTPGYFFSSGNITNPGALTKLFFNKINVQGIDCYPLVDFLIAEDVFVLKFVNAQDPNNVIYLKPSALVDNGTYFEITVEDYEGFFNGGLVDESIYFIDFEFIPLEQNNLYKEKFLGFYSNQTEFNNLFNQELKVEEDELFILVWGYQNPDVFVTEPPIIYRYKFARGKGTWNPIPKSVGDIIFESVNQVTGGDMITIINGANTQTYDLEDIEDVAIVSFINANGPYNLTSGTLVYYFIYESDSITYLYQFIGTNGTYGFGEAPITESDLKFITSSGVEPVVVPTKTSDLLNDGADGENPFITLNDLPPIPEPSQEKQSLNYVVADLFDLGVASFDEITPQIVEEYSESLEKPNTDNALFTLDIYEVYPNFDVTGNWEEHSSGNSFGQVTDQASFVTFLENQGFSSIEIDYFDLTDGRLQAKLTVSGFSILDLRYLEITEVRKLQGFVGLQQIYLSNNNLTVFNPELPLLEPLFRLDLFNNQLETFNPTLPLPSTLIILLLNNNQIETFNPLTPLPNGLKNLSIQSNLIYWFDPSLPLPSSLEELSLGSNQIEEFEPSFPLPTSLKLLFFQGNPLYYINIDFSLLINLEQLSFSTSQMSAFNIGSTLPTSLTYLGFFNAQFNTAGYEASEDWATAQPAFLSTCNVEFTGNPDSVSGTNLETILISKNCNVII